MKNRPKNQDEIFAKTVQALRAGPLDVTYSDWPGNKVTYSRPKPLYAWQRRGDGALPEKDIELLQTREKLKIQGDGFGPRNCGRARLITSLRRCRNGSLADANASLDRRDAVKQNYEQLSDQLPATIRVEGEIGDDWIELCKRS